MTVPSLETLHWSDTETEEGFTILNVCLAFSSNEDNLFVFWRICWIIDKVINGKQYKYTLHYPYYVLKLFIIVTAKAEAAKTVLYVLVNLINALN